MMKVERYIISIYADLASIHNKQNNSKLAKAIVYLNFDVSSLNVRVSSN
jgi:hypothetical protein